MTTETLAPASIQYRKGTDAYNDRLGLFRVAFGLKTEPDIIKCSLNEVHIQENGKWEQLFPTTD